MDPHKLLPSEIDYELAIRGVSGITSKRQKGLALSDLLKNEALGIDTNPVSSAFVFTVGDELERCQGMMKHLYESIQVEEETGIIRIDESIESRLIHLKNRIKRIHPEVEAQKLKLKEIQDQCMEILGIVAGVRPSIGSRISNNYIAHQIHPQIRRSNEARGSQQSAGEGAVGGEVGNSGVLLSAQVGVDNFVDISTEMRPDNNVTMNMPVMTNDERRHTLTPLIFRSTEIPPVSNSMFHIDQQPALSRQNKAQSESSNVNMIDIANEMRGLRQTISNQSGNRANTGVSTIDVEKENEEERAAFEEEVRRQNCAEGVVRRVNEMRTERNTYNVPKSTQMPVKSLMVTIDQRSGQQSRSVKLQRFGQHQIYDTTQFARQMQPNSDFQNVRRPDDHVTVGPPQVGYNEEQHRLMPVYRTLSEARCDYSQRDVGAVNHFNSGRSRSAFKSVPINQWQVSFNGEGRGMHLFDFLSQVRMYQRSEMVTDEELLRAMTHLLTGRAKRWYESIYESIGSWNELVEALKREYLPRNYPFTLINDMSNRRQRVNETFGEYY